jgi:hypothetical protein
MVIGVSLAAIALAPAASSASGHSGARVATLADFDQSITAQNATFSVTTGGTLSEPAGTLQTGATDSDSNATCCTVAADPSNPPQDGTLSVDANGDGGFTYTPDSGFTGTDTFGFILSDTDSNTAGGTVTVNVNPVAVAAAAASYVTDQGSALPLPAGTLQTNDSDNNPDSGATCCTAALSADPSDGTVSVDSNGSFTYTPDSGFSGTDTFDYTLTDSDGVVSPATPVTVNVVPNIPDTVTQIVEANPPAASPSVPVTFTAQVTPKTSGKPTPTGTVTFTWYRTGGKNGGGPLTGTIGTATLEVTDAGNTASLTTKNGDLEAGVVDGSITITATYSGSPTDSSSAASIQYYVEATCDEGQWPSVSNGIPHVTSTGTPEGYYLGQSNGRFSLYVSSPPGETVKFTGYIKINGLILYLSPTKDKTDDHFTVKGPNVVNYSIKDHGHLDGFTFYAGCGSEISFNLKINNAPAPKSMIFLGNPTSNATKNPVVLTRSS